MSETDEWAGLEASDFVSSEIVTRGRSAAAWSRPPAAVARRSIALMGDNNAARKGGMAAAGVGLQGTSARNPQPLTCHS